MSSARLFLACSLAACSDGLGVPEQDRRQPDLAPPSCGSLTTYGPCSERPDCDIDACHACDGSFSTFACVDRASSVRMECLPIFCGHAEGCGVLGNEALCAADPTCHAVFKLIDETKPTGPSFDRCVDGGIRCSWNGAAGDPCGGPTPACASAMGWVLSLDSNGCADGCVRETACPSS